MASLRGRLSGGLLISLIVILVLQWFYVSEFIGHLGEGYVESRLTHDAESILSALYIDKRGVIKLAEEKIGAIYHRPFSGHYYKIFFEGYEPVRSRSLWDNDIKIPLSIVGKSVKTRVIGPQGQNLMLLTSGYMKYDRAVSISVAEDVTRMEADIKNFQAGYAIVSFFGIAMLMLTQWAIVRRGLAPLGRAREDLLKLERGEVESIESDVPTEVRPLVDEINQLLKVMTERLKRSRKAVGNLAHALKTPLTAISRLSEDTEIADSEMRSTLKKNSEFINNLIDRELARARLAGPLLMGQSVVVEKDISDLIITLEQIYRDKNISIEWNPAHPEFSILADREDIMELLGILLDNACKWAKSRVLFSVTCAPDVSFIVEDDGPGCPQDKLELLKVRGVRLDESGHGHGLGLSIAADIVDSYSGTIEFGRSDKLGGFCAAVRLANVGTA